MYCQNCGQSNPADAVQCSACGVTLAIAAPPPPAPRAHVPNNLVWAILATLFCCLPGGIVAIVYAARVDGKLAVELALQIPELGERMCAGKVIRATDNPNAGLAALYAAGVQFTDISEIVRRDITRFVFNTQREHFRKGGV